MSPTLYGHAHLDGVRRALERLRTEQGRADARYRVSRQVLNPVLQPLGFVVVADHYYQPLHTDRAARAVATEHEPIWSARDDADAAVLLDRLLGTYAEEFRSEQGPAARFGFSAPPSQVGTCDQEVLYAMVRDRRPSRVVEIGAGGSTMIIAAALAANGDGASFTSVEPYPSPWLSERVQAIAAAVDFDLRASAVQDVGRSLAVELGPDDLLFVDSSHVHRPGSDVEYEFLEMYPALADGVVLHVHDIFLPSDYPSEWNTVHRRYWNEQYVLEAVLRNSGRYRTLLPLCHLASTRPEVFEAHLPGFERGVRPGSFWAEVTSA